MQTATFGGKLGKATSVLSVQGANKSITGTFVADNISDAMDLAMAGGFSEYEGPMQVAGRVVRIRAQAKATRTQGDTVTFQVPGKPEILD